MERALELPHDVDALHALVLAHRELIVARETTIAERDAKIAELAHQCQELRKLVFGKSSEKRTSTPFEPGLQGSLFLADIAAEAERLAEQHRVVATVEVPAHPRPRPKRRGEFPDHLPLVRTVCELRDADRVCACGGELSGQHPDHLRARAHQDLEHARENVGRHYQADVADHSAATWMPCP